MTGMSKHRIVWDVPQTCRLCGQDTMHDSRVCTPCARLASIRGGDRD